MSMTDANGFFEFGDGSNLRTGTNPPYAVSDFTTSYPQFGNNSQGQPVVPTAVLQSFVDLANACLQEPRWHSLWKPAMGWFIAHFCTLYLQTMASADSGANAVFDAGRAQGVITGKSVGDLSVSFDQNLSGIDGWAAWKLTAFGQQLATMGKLVGKGGMYVY